MVSVTFDPIDLLLALAIFAYVMAVIMALVRAYSIESGVKTAGMYGVVVSLLMVCVNPWLAFLLILATLTAIVLYLVITEE